MIVALAGGVGGAKLADGLAQVLGCDLTVIVNTGDDFEHLGLNISPDLDTVMYTLAGIANPATGWGIAGESWSFLDQLNRLGAPAWFRLGDRDLATHIVRTARLRGGETLTAITTSLCAQLGIAARVLPMSDASVRTIVETDSGPLPFQEYFVARQCAVPVTGFSFAGIAQARPSSAVCEALGAEGLRAVVVCPSNPFVSIDPILAVPGMSELLRARGVPIVAVSPIIGGAAVKGPAAKMLQELGMAVSATAVAAHYRGLLRGMVIDVADAALAADIAAMDIAVEVAPTMMRNATDRRELAETCLAFADRLALK